MKPPQRERVSRFSPSIYLSYAAGWVMRIWREEDMSTYNNYVPGHTQADRDIAATVQRFVNHPVTQLDLAKAVLELERVNAVEIVDMAGFGEKVTKDGRSQTSA
jgi:hypothetical protein